MQFPSTLHEFCVLFFHIIFFLHTELFGETASKTQKKYNCYYSKKGLERYSIVYHFCGFCVPNGSNMVLLH